MPPQHHVRRGPRSPFLLQDFWRATYGATFVEYTVVLGVVALLAVAGFRMFGTALYSKSRTFGDNVRTLTPVSGSSNYCFAAGTLVATPDGLRPIESIREGDTVYSRSDRDTPVIPARVGQTFITKNAVLVDVHFVETVEPIRTTPGHLFFTADRSWAEAQSLAPGEDVLSASGESIHVARVSRVPDTATVYNFTVDETHTYFVGSKMAWVHNPALDCNGVPMPEPAPAPATPITVYNIPPECQDFGDVKPGTSVFWTGGQMTEAQAFASQNGKTTLEDTACYAAIQSNVAAQPWSDAKPVFNETSQNYAAHASGVVEVVVPDGYDPYKPPPNGDNVWSQVEYPTLSSNPRVTQICYNIQSTPPRRVCP